MHAKKSLTLLVPVLNEEEAIPVFLKRCQPLLEQVSREWLGGGRCRILFVDDGSTDGTAAVIAAAIAANPHIQCIRFSRNFGKEAALAAGFRHAVGDAVIPIDVDLQDPPELILDMVRLWLSGAEIVNAVRVTREADSAAKRLSARAFYALYNRLADVPIENDAGDFRLLDRMAVDALNGMPERIRFTKGLYSWIGFRTETITFDRPARTAGGESRWRPGRLWSFAIDGLVASTTKPLRIWSYIGGIVGLLALVYATIIVGRTLLYGVDVPGYASLIVVILFLGGLNLFSLGILGEYVGRIAMEVRERPLYVIRERIGFHTVGLAEADEAAAPAAEAAREQAGGRA